MRQANHDYLIESKDVGFIPEARWRKSPESIPLYDYARSGNYDVKKVVEAAELASLGDPKNLTKLTEDAER